jgi:ankyrin repeat protein
MVQTLLAHGADANSVDNFGRTPLLEAVRAMQEPSARLLRARGAELGLLMLAPVGAHAGEGQGPGAVQETGAGAGASRRAGSAAAVHNRVPAGAELCHAVFERRHSYLRLLLDFGCSVGAADYDFRTAAHLACAENDLPACLLLHEHGADFWCTPQTPSSVSSLALSSSSAKVGGRDRWGRSPLEEAEYHGHHELVTVLRALRPKRTEDMQM